MMITHEMILGEVNKCTGGSEIDASGVCRRLGYVGAEVGVGAMLEILASKGLIRKNGRWYGTMNSNIEEIRRKECAYQQEG